LQLDRLMRVPAPVLLLIGLGTAAVAEQPLLRPSRDVSIVYRAAGPQGTVVEQRVRWLASSQIERIDPPDHNLHVIIDHIARRMSVVNDAARSVMETATSDGMREMPAAQPQGSYARLGQGSVAGRSCTEWQALDRLGHEARVCVTNDGVLLRAGTPDAVRVTAVSVDYAPQDAAAFRIPADYAHLAPGASR
jgi:hypothetical protein